MPKLVSPSISKGKAIFHLIQLYRNEPSFMQEVKLLRKPYEERILNTAAAWIDFWFYCRDILPIDRLPEFWMNYYIGSGQPDTLPDSFINFLKQIQQEEYKLAPYKDELTKLMIKWKLNIPVAVDMLMLLDSMDVLKEFGVPTECEVPFEDLDYCYPFPAVLPPLEINISANRFAFYSKQQIMSIIRKQLTEYESSAKKAGLKEPPSALEIHAKWWYEHYVNKKSYGQLAIDYPAKKDTSLGVDRSGSIKRAVYEFSKLIAKKKS